MNLCLNVFKTSAHAKCILAGEHAVLRGCPALVLPIKKMLLNFHYIESNNALTIENISNNFRKNERVISTLNKIILTALKQSFIFLNNSNINKIQGNIYIENHIPIGAGLGFSAALCVVITQFLIWKHLLDEEKLFPFARRLESLFHHKSSGLDIQGVISECLVHYETSGNTYEVQTSWLPKLYVSYSGVNKSTSDFVKKAMQLKEKNPDLAHFLDEEIKLSVSMIENALSSDEKTGISMMVSAINHAKHCFKEWGLVTQKLQTHMDQLLKLGALAVKPTGAGGGGYVLSLWKNPPVANTEVEFISIF